MMFWKFAAATTALVISTSANAALVERLNGQAYYDTEADLTWLADAINPSPTSEQVSPMTWTEANNWATSLSVEGVDGWRLPTTDACLGFDCTGSEMGNMIYNVLGGSADSNIYTTHNANFDLFTNLIPRVYWTGSPYTAPFDTSNPAYYVFNMWSAYQTVGGENSPAFAWAVHSGDVASVPVPAAVWLFGSGLIGLSVFARRKNKP